MSANDWWVAPISDKVECALYLYIACNVLAGIGCYGWRELITDLADEGSTVPVPQADL
jgi:hypothetical protein